MGYDDDVAAFPLAETQGTTLIWHSDARVVGRSRSLA